MKNVKKTDSNFVNSAKVGAYGAQLPGYDNGSVFTCIRRGNSAGNGFNGKFILIDRKRLLCYYDIEKGAAVEQRFT